MLRVACYVNVSWWSVVVIKYYYWLIFISFVGPDHEGVTGAEAAAGKFLLKYVNEIEVRVFFKLYVFSILTYIRWLGASQ